MEEIKLIGEHWKDNILGLTFNDKLKNAIHAKAQREYYKFALEQLERNGKLNANIHETTVLAVLHPKTNKIIDIAFNDEKDLILNNFGTWLAGLITTPVDWTEVVVKNITLTDSDNSSQTVKLYARCFTTSNNNNLFNAPYATTAGQPIGAQIMLGSGTTAAARTDYAIETPLSNAPENTFFDVSPASYGAGNISFTGAVTAGGSGTANESGLFFKWAVVGSNIRSKFMMFHDILASGVAYTAGNILNTSYSITL